MGRAAACCSHDGGVAHGVTVKGDIFAPSRLRVIHFRAEAQRHREGALHKTGTDIR